MQTEQKVQTELYSEPVSLLTQRLCIPGIQVSVLLSLFPELKLMGYHQTAGCLPVKHCSVQTDQMYSVAVNMRKDQTVPAEHLLLASVQPVRSGHTDQTYSAEL